MGVLKNKRHEQFAHAVAKGTKARTAYIAAGFSPNGADGAASKLQKSAKVAARIAEIKANIDVVVTEKTGIDKAWVLEQLVSNVRIAKAAEPVLDNEGKPTGEYKANINAANRALELIGKEFGMFVDRKEIRTGELDDIPHEEKKKALDVVRDELAKRAGKNGRQHPIH